MLCQRLAVKITKTERYWIAISLGRFVGKKQDYYFCIIDCSDIFRFPPFSLSFQLCDGRGIGADNFNEEAKRRSFKKKSHSSAGRKN